jgi:uncharacterized protein YkwD
MRRVLVSCLVLASTFASSGVAAAEPADNTSFALRVLELTNAERESAGLVPLTLNSKLADSAQGYSEVLASSGCFEHTCGPVPNFADRDGQAGYTDWTDIGENIAGGYATPEAVVAGWMASPGHRENILSPQFTEIGIGVASGGGPYGTYWTQEFGTRG